MLKNTMCCMVNTHESKTPLYHLRKAKGLTQKQVADAVGTVPTQIAKLENGTRKLAPEWIERLAKALNCTKAELLGEESHDGLTQREKMLLDYFRNSDESGQDLLLKTGDTLSKLSKKGLTDGRVG